MKHYYEAYDERYRTIHARGVSWAADVNTPIVRETVEKYGLTPAVPMLEIGCGEGRDARFLLERGYDLLATDVSPEAVAYCKKRTPAFADRFRVLDCLEPGETGRYAFIYAVAVIHMLLLPEDRNAFYRFIRDHLAEDGIGLICTMGDGQAERVTDPGDAFRLQEREHPSGKLLVAATSLKMVSFPHFVSELTENGLQILEQGLTACPPEFGSLMYAVVKGNETLLPN